MPLSSSLKQNLNKSGKGLACCFAGERSPVGRVSSELSSTAAFRIRGSSCEEDRAGERSVCQAKELTLEQTARCYRRAELTPHQPPPLAKKNFTLQKGVIKVLWVPGRGPARLVGGGPK